MKTSAKTCAKKAVENRIRK